MEMRLILATIALLSGCSDGSGSDAGVLPTPVCVGEGRTLDNEGVASNWSTTSVDAELRTLSYLTWDDADRTDLGSREVNIREGDLLLVQRVDADGDGRDEAEMAWTYDGLDRLVLFEARVDDSLDEAGTGIGWRERTTYGADGQIAEREMDTYGDGEIETLYRYHWADGRQERMDTVSFVEGRSSGTTTWTWFDPPPGLDYVAEARAEGEETPSSTTERHFDPSGNLVFESQSYIGGETRIVRWTRDGDGRPDEVLESTALGSVRTTLAYDARGLMVRAVRESDVGTDGSVEDVQTTERDWTCTDG